MGLYTSWERINGKYPDFGKDFQADVTNSYLIPGAEGEVSAALAIRYPIPLPFASDFVADIATDLTYYKAKWRMEGMAALKTYIDARLTQIINGTVTLVGSGGSTITPATQVGNVTSGYGSSFGMDNVVNFRVDSQWQADSQAARGDYCV